MHTEQARTGNSPVYLMALLLASLMIAASWWLPLVEPIWMRILLTIVYVVVALEVLTHTYRYGREDQAELYSDSDKHARSDNSE